MPNKLLLFVEKYASMSSMLASVLIKKLEQIVSREGDGEVQMKQDAGWSNLGEVLKDDDDGCILLGF